MLKIDIHTHILPESLPKFKDQFGYGGFIELQQKNSHCARMLRDDGKFFREVNCNCWDAKTRLEECDQADVHVQVLSTVPVMFSYWAKPQDGLTISRFLNNHIAEIVAEYPQRFIGLGTLPLQDTELAIQELDRCVNELNFPGVQIGSNVNGRNLDDENLLPVFAAAEKLNACIFIHPWQMLGSTEIPDYWLPWLVGMPAETARAVCSMIFGGVFARFPKLRVAFAHGGGAFPATIGRIEHGFKVRPDLCAIKNNINPRDYLGHFYIDSLVHDARMLQYLLEIIGPERIALGTDYPFPLGELQPGELIDSMPLEANIKQQLFADTALTWLGLEKANFYDSVSNNS